MTIEDESMPGEPVELVKGGKKATHRSMLFGNVPMPFLAAEVVLVSCHGRFEW
jgi:hypothetical protein